MKNIKKIPLPELGEGITEGELVKWLVSEGDPVQSDQVLAEVMTDKAVMEVPSATSGVVESLLVKEGETIPVGQTLLTIKVAGGASHSLESSSHLDPKADPSDKTAIAEPSTPPKDTSYKDKQTAMSPSKEQATPLTRRLAKELGVELSRVTGSLAGRITKEDVLKYSQAQKTLNVPVTDPAKEQRIPLKGIRKKIADTMQLSKQTIPHFSLLDSANIEKLDEIKKSVQEMLKDKEIKITYLAFIMKAILQTALEFPEVNASIDTHSDEIILKKYYNFGFAVDTPRGLLVPVIKNVDQKNLTELAQAIQQLAQTARDGSIKRDDMVGGTLTITNIGSLGGQGGTPIINPPEVIIFGIYRLFVKPYWNGQTFEPQKTMNFSITCDHRLIDGAVAARILNTFIQKIESPFSLFI